jgi:hypothetical protein
MVVEITMFLLSGSGLPIDHDCVTLRHFSEVLKVIRQMPGERIVLTDDIIV